jgi:hypothetical protein
LAISQFYRLMKRVGGYALPPLAWYIGGVAMGKEILVGEAELRRMVRERRGLRIDAEMGKYLLGKLNDVDQRVAVIGADARTGVARREILDMRLLGLEHQ